MDLIDIQKNIEEKRLIWGKNLENILVKYFFGFFVNLWNLLVNFSQNKRFLSISCLLIMFFSVFIRSFVDIGHDSAVFVEMSQKILNGGRYYHDIFENNFPFSIYMGVIPVFIANKLGFNSIVIFDIFMNLVGLGSLYLCYKLFEIGEFNNKSAISKIDRYHKSNRFYLWLKSFKLSENSSKNVENKGISLESKLLIIFFAFGYFFRIYTLQFNEYLTKSSWYLAILFPYIVANFYSNDVRKVGFVKGILAGLLVAVKPHYGLIFFGFEVIRLRDFIFSDKFDIKKLIKEIFCFSNQISLIVLALYFAFIVTFVPEYFEFLENFAVLYYGSVNNYLIYDVIKEDIFPVLLFLLIFQKEVKKVAFSKYLIVALICSMIIVIVEVLGGYDQRFVVFSLFFAIFFPTLYYIFKDRRIDFKQNWFLYLAILIISQFDPKFFFDLVFGILYIWWIFLFFKKKFRFNLILLALMSIFLLRFNELKDFSWLVCAIIFLIGIKRRWFFYPEDLNKNISKAYSIIGIINISYFLSLILISIFSYDGLKADYVRSPNRLNDYKSRIINEYVNKNEEVLFIANSIYHSQPVLAYLDKINPVPFHHFSVLYENVRDKNYKDSDLFVYDNKMRIEGLKYYFSSLKKQMKNVNNKLIFVKLEIYSKNSCKSGFLEYYLKDKEFREIFETQYEFLTEFHDIIEIEKFDDLNKNNLREAEKRKFNFRYDFFEVYIRKDDK